MRLSPSAPGSFWREITADGLSVLGVPLPKGSEAGVGIYALFHNDKYFPDPWSFRPERFIQRQVDGKDGAMHGHITISEATNSSAFVPFLLGPRRCPAQELAYLQLTLALARMVWDLDFEVAGEPGEGGQSGMGWGRLVNF